VLHVSCMNRNQILLIGQDKIVATSLAYRTSAALFRASNRETLNITSNRKQGLILQQAMEVKVYTRP
jgi:hypothetical protein